MKFIKYLKSLFECNHDFRFNFPSIPNKGICKKCKMKITFNGKDLEWEENEFTDSAGRTDEELIKQWHI